MAWCYVSTFPTHGITPYKLGSDFYTNTQRKLVRHVLYTTFYAGVDGQDHQTSRRRCEKTLGRSSGIGDLRTAGDDRLQCVITGFHLTTRATVDKRSNVAFGGPITHGHQPSGFYEQVGHPDNIFWYQTVKANEVFQGLDKTRQDKGLIKRAMPTGRELSRRAGRSPWSRTIPFWPQGNMICCTGIGPVGIAWNGKHWSRADQSGRTECCWSVRSSFLLLWGFCRPAGAIAAETPDDFKSIERIGS
jgi:hypothetical protein